MFPKFEIAIRIILMMKNLRISVRNRSSKNLNWKKDERIKPNGALGLQTIWKHSVFFRFEIWKNHTSFFDALPNPLQIGDF